MVSPTDKRRQYVTGFSGTAGTAVVTDKQAALWVDGRYHLQADQQLDCQWIVMKSGQEKVRPSLSIWFISKWCAFLLARRHLDVFITGARDKWLAQIGPFSRRSCRCRSKISQCRPVASMADCTRYFFPSPKYFSANISTLVFPFFSFPSESWKWNPIRCRSG